MPLTYTTVFKGRLFHETFDFIPKSNSSISSVPAHLCHCIEALGCSLSLHYTVYPGQVVTLKVMA